MPQKQNCTLFFECRRYPIVAHRRLIGLLGALLVVFVAAQLDAQVLDSPGDRVQKTLQKQVKNAKPYQITSRIHLQEGSQQGYLVVEVKLKKGNHIYSLTQPGKVPATKLTVATSKDFRLTAPFSPDTPAKVINHDPGFGQRIEKHTGTIQFFAPLEISSTADLSKIVANVQFDGQVCTTSSCLPLRKLKLQGKFAGYFDAPKNTTDTPAIASQPGGRNPAIQRQ